MLHTDLANDFRFCRDVTRRSASSFYYALRLLPRARRKALYAVYAFCRAVDDAADEADAADAPQLIAEWRAELERCYRGAPLHPVTVALAASLEQFPRTGALGHEPLALPVEESPDQAGIQGGSGLHGASF